MLRIKKNEWYLPLVFYLLVFQNPLESVHSIFKYIDELLGLFGITVLMIRAYQNRTWKIKNSSARILLAFMIFMVSGLLGNIIYQYQPVQAVVTDIYVNMKFYLSVISGYVLFSICDSERERKQLIQHTHIVVLAVFVMLAADQLFHVFHSPESRYGLRASKLIFSHPTYLAGAAVFLLTVLTAFYEKRNNRYLVMCLVTMFFTLRGKAIVGAAVFCFVFYFFLICRKKLKFWHIVSIGLFGLSVAWERLYFYYFELKGRSARSVLTQTSFEILKDYFPIGTGFGTYASHSATEYYSPVYVKYGFLKVYELGRNGPGFFDDTFWPIIIGQTGLIGTVAYLSVLVMLFLRVLKIRTVNISAYTAGIFIFAYLMISSTSEPTFNNSVSIPLAMMLGYIFSLEKRVAQHSRNKETG